MNTCLPQSIDPKQTFIGSPQVVQKSRTKYLHRLNETPSLMDHVFTNKTAPLPASLMESYVPMIEQHIDRRVMCFFMQLVACFRTNLHFELGTTLDQGESATTLTLRTKEGKSIPVQRNAAHSSVIPCLIAAQKNNKKQQAQHQFVYIKGSDIYRLENSTLDMPREINEADMAIDGKSEDSSLRSRALALLNQASKGDLNPVNGLSQFLGLMQSTVKGKIPQAKKENIRICLQMYDQNLERIKTQLAKSSAWTDHFLGLDLDCRPSTIAIRPKLYDIRYKAIQDTQFFQSELLQKIKSVHDRILNQAKRKPSYFEEAFREHLLSTIEQQEHKIFLKTLWNFPVGSATNNQKAAAKKLLSTHSQKIQQLAEDVEQSLVALKGQEAKRRGKVLAEIREAKQLSLKDLDKLIHKKFPKSIDQGLLNDCENGKKRMGKTIAYRLSRVLHVDPVLFLPYSSL